MMRHILTLILFATLLLVGSLFSEGLSTGLPQQSWLLVIGVLLLVAYAFGEALRPIGLPALLGYIITGVVLGPSLAALLPGDFPLAIISEEVIARLDQVQVLVIGVVGMLAGAKFRFAEISENLRLLIRVTLAILLLVIPLTMAAVLLSAQFFPQSLAFVAAEPFATQVTIALFFGVLAFGLSPSITIALFQELLARGPLTTAILGVVILGEFLLFFLFALVLSLGTSLAGAGELSTSAALALVPGALGQLTLSVVLGLGIGVLTAAFLRYVRKETLLFIIAVLLLGYFAVIALEAIPLMTFLVAGFFVQNMTKQGDPLVKTLDRIALPVFVVYFTLVAAAIDLQGLVAYAPLVIALIVARITALYWGTRWATKTAMETHSGYEYLRTSFISQDAVVLVLAGVVAVEFPAWGAPFQSVIVATVIAYLIAGPILLKLSLDRSGESSRQSRQPAGKEGELLAPRTRLVRKPDLAQVFLQPSFEDSWLRGHIEDLRLELVTLSDTLILKPVQAQYDALHESLEEISHLLDNQSDSLAMLVDQVRQGADDKALIQLVAELQKDYSRQIQPLLSMIEQIQGDSLHADTIREFLTRLRSLEDQDSLYRIERERTLFETHPHDPLWIRTVKGIRRGHARFSGTGYRTVPVGRLWRFYVELALPIRLVRTIPPVVTHYEELWRQLWLHLRRLDGFWTNLIEELTRPHESEAQEEHRPASARAQDVEQRIEAFLQDFHREQTELDTQAEKSITLILNQVLGPLVGAYERFLDAVSLAGTIHLPAFRYRPAARFGPARRGEERLLERLQRQEDIVAGYRGWIRLDHEVLSFVQGSRLFQGRVVESCSRALGTSWREHLTDLLERCDASHDLFEDAGLSAKEAREALYREELQPRILRARKRQEDLLTAAQKGRSTRSLQSHLEAGIARMPEEISVRVGDQERLILNSAATRYDLPLRRWLASKVGRPMALRIVEFNGDLEDFLEERLTLLSSVEQILEFHLVTSQPDPSLDPAQADVDQPPEAIAAEGLSRVKKLVEEHLEETLTSRVTLQNQLSDELTSLVKEALDPISARRLGEVQRVLARQAAASLVSRSESWLSEFLEPVTRRLQGLRLRAGEYFGEFSAELRSLLLTPPEEVDPFEIRQILRADSPTASTEAPAIYRRLFVPSPLDIAEFYRPRHQAETQLLETARQFFAGASHTVLITGPPGIGKRTFVQHVVPSRLFAVEPGFKTEQALTLRLSDVPRDEAALSAHLGEALLGSATPEDFKRLTTLLRRSAGPRRVVVIEQAEQLMLRSEAGLEMSRSFLEMMEATSDKILWILLMGRAAAEFLDTHIELSSYFTHQQALRAMNADEIEELIMARHRVSGFELSFDPPHLQRLERLRRPFLGARARQIPRKVFFERLADRAAGNPTAALLIWLSALGHQAMEESRLTVRALRPPAGRLLTCLPLRHRLLLATIYLHQSITGDEAALLLLEPPELIERDLRHLQRLGFVESRSEPSTAYSIRPFATVAVRAELVALNLI